jgi:Na+/H+ antiporter NhaC
MTQQHTGAKSVLIVLVLGVVILLGVYAFRFLDPLAAIALSAIVLVATFYFSLKIWKVKR